MTTDPSYSIYPTFDEPIVADPSVGAGTTHTKPLANTRALVVEDEQFMSNLLVQLLTRWGCEVLTAQDGYSALSMLRNTPCDLVLLDIRIPDLDGVSVCRELRTFSDAVVIMLTALNRPDDVVEGFMAGADDYVVKPFRFPELFARISANLRRAALMRETRQAADDPGNQLQLNHDSREAVFAERVIRFSSKEFALLSYLVERADRPVDKAELLHKIWGRKNMKFAYLVETAVRRVRVKLERDPAQPRHLVTCRPAGYMFVTPVDAVTSDSTGQTE